MRFTTAPTHAATASRRGCRRRGISLTAVVAAVALIASASPAAAARIDTTMKDPRGDASPTLDITKVEVSHSADAVKVTVKVRRWAAMKSASRVPTQVGVHFDTRGDRRPDHLMRIGGFHYLTGSTRDWNELRPNGLDPYGDWLRCFPAGWNKPLIQPRPAKNLLVFNAPRKCLGNPSSVRVAVQSYKPYRSKVTPDWVGTPRSYSERVALR